MLNQKELIVLLIVVVVLLIQKGDTNPSDTESTLKMVSGTEYVSGEEGQVIVRIQDSLGNPVVGVGCHVTILYPNKTYAFDNMSMMQSANPGNYYFSFETPPVDGIYEELISCNLGDPYYVSSSFHVSPALNSISQLQVEQTEAFDHVVSMLESDNRSVSEGLESLRQDLSDLSGVLDNHDKRMGASLGDVEIRQYERFARLGQSIDLIFGGGINGS